MSETAVRVMIQGKVQGVWYRGWTVDQANARGLRGWVRNRRDGSVEALFIGTKAKVESMIAACDQGPPAARVDLVECFPAGDSGETGFVQRDTE